MEDVAPPQPLSERPAPSPGPGRPVPGSARSALRWLGATLFLVTAALPVYGCRAHPKDFDAQPRSSNHFILRERNDRVPLHEITTDMRAGWKEGGLVKAVWEERKWYPYLLGPLWIAALFAASRPRSRLARRAGWAVFASSVAVAVFEAFYLAADYRGVSSGWFHGVETSLVWLVVCAILFWRPSGAALLDPGALVSSQALLAVGHALTFPVYDGAAWLGEGFSTSAVVSTIATNYRPGFWLALCGLGLAAAPLYVPALFRARVTAPTPREPAADARDTSDARDAVEA